MKFSFLYYCKCFGNCLVEQDLLTSQALHCPCLDFLYNVSLQRQRNKL